MKVHFGLPEKALQPGWLTIGTFDGVHRGHAVVIDRLRRGAAPGGSGTTVLTFDPHPRCVLQPDRCPPSLTTVDEKADVLAGLGVDNLVVLPFTRRLSELTATDFMRLLAHSIPLRGLVAGYDFALGHQRRGGRLFLQRYGERHRFDVDIVEEQSFRGTIVSSSLVRALLLEGDVTRANRLLGRQYSISSLVEAGTGTGSRIGYPTANLTITPNKLVPMQGVYAVWVDIGGSTYPGAMNVGYRPTFGENRLTVEVFVLDFQRDIYREEVKARVVRRIRDEKKFESIDALVAQIGRDVKRVRSILGR